jgi:endonuclease/exonuclease/phosphatase family metal-dependent hydrolase
LLAVAVGCALVVALTGGSRPPATTEAPASAPGHAGLTRGTGSTFSLMQMNLCLSGLAGCYDRAAYPAVVLEAVARIREARPAAVTLSEACARDAGQIAESTGYHLRFARVIYLGEQLSCRDPGGRGLFGDAVLTKAPIDASESRPFETQDSIEQRRWLCVTTRPSIDVCTAHLNTRLTISDAATNDAQCAELAALLTRRADARTVAFSGDVNRRGSCAPVGIWTRTDSSADQAPGVQHVYGSAAALRSPSVQVVPADHSDHDVLLVHAQLVPGWARSGPAHLRQ